MNKELIIERSANKLLGSAQTRTDYCTLDKPIRIFKLDIEAILRIADYTLEEQLEEIYKNPSIHKYEICEEYSKLQPFQINYYGRLLNVFKTSQFIYSHTAQFITICEYIQTTEGIDFMVFHYPTRKIVSVVSYDSSCVTGDLYNHLKYSYTYYLRDLIICYTNTAH